MQSPALPNAPAPPPGVMEIFLSFALVSISGFGGVLAWARRMIVEQKRWMSPEEFNDAFALCQLLPGGNIINFSAVFGARFAGLPGAVAAFLGLMVPPMLIVTAISAAYALYGDIEAVRRILGGVSAAMAGMIVATAGKMAMPVLRKPFGPWHVLMVVVILAIAVLRLPLPWVLAVTVPAGLAAVWWWHR